jgi:hypothetical protein
MREATLRLSLAQIEAFPKEGAAFANELRTHLDGEFWSFSLFSLFSSFPLFSRFSMFESLEDDGEDENKRVRRVPHRRNQS